MKTNIYTNNLDKLFLPATAISSTTGVSDKTIVDDLTELNVSISDVNSKLDEYVTDKELQNAIATSKISKIKGTVDSVELLPTSDNADGDIWLVGTVEDTNKKEYMYISELGKFEEIGIVNSLTINSFYTKEEIDSLISTSVSEIVTTVDETLDFGILTPALVASDISASSSLNSRYSYVNVTKPSTVDGWLAARTYATKVGSWIQFKLPEVPPLMSVLSLSVAGHRSTGLHPLEILVQAVQIDAPLLDITTYNSKSDLDGVEVIDLSSTNLSNSTAIRLTCLTPELQYFGMGYCPGFTIGTKDI